MSVKPIPDGYHAVTPYIVADDVGKLIEFLKKAFDGEVIECIDSPHGVMHAEVKIRDSILMMGQKPGEPTPSKFYLYVEDVDAEYAKAITAGGTSVQEPADQFYGDRTSAVKDSQGNEWWIATRKENLSEAELEERAKAAMAQKV